MNKPGIGVFIAISVIAVALLGGLLYWGSGPRRPAAMEPASDGEQAPRKTLRLYCAAGIRLPVADIVKEYEEKYNARVEVDYAGSGALLSKIRAASKGDLYLAADKAYIEDGKKLGLLREHVPIAWQRPALAVAKGNPQKIQGMSDLLRDDVRVSLAEAKVAAISRAAKKLLAQHAEKDSATPQWDKVFAAATTARGTVNEVANDIKSGAVDAGVVWDATAGQYPELETVHVEAFQSNPKQICMSILEDSKQPSAALHFLRYATAEDKGLLHFKRHGYEVVQGDKWAEQPELIVFAGGLNRPAISGTLREFEEREGVTVTATYNGCGVLVGQIKTGARPDVYFACDTTFIEMDKVRQLFTPPQDVSSTRMVLITHRDRADKLQVKTLEDLTRPGLKVGVTHPEKSALGFLSQRLLQKNNLWEKVFPNLKDLPPTADRLVEHVVLGSLDAAIVYKANTTLQREKLMVIDLPDPAALANQPIAVAKDTDHPQLAGRLVDAIRTEKSRDRFLKLGFDWSTNE